MLFIIILVTAVLEFQHSSKQWVIMCVVSAGSEEKSSSSASEAEEKEDDAEAPSFIMGKRWPNERMDVSSVYYRTIPETPHLQQWTFTELCLKILQINVSEVHSSFVLESDVQYLVDIGKAECFSFIGVLMIKLCDLDRFDSVVNM